MPAMYPPIHHSVWFTRPGSSGSPLSSFALECRALISFQRIARTCVIDGAVETTRAVPGGHFASHRAAARAAMNDLPASWHDGTATFGTSSSRRRISRCFDQRSMFRAFLAHTTGSISDVLVEKRRANPVTGL